MIICPKCGQENKDKVRNCIKCDVNLQYALDNAEKYLAERKAKEVEQVKFTNLILTTTPGIDGKTILQYLGIVSSIVVLGTGLISEIDANLADFFGTRSELFQEKIIKARGGVLNEMKNQAIQLNGDGIVGISLDYEIFRSNMIMVSGSGTAVKFSTQEGGEETD